MRVVRWFVGSWVSRIYLVVVIAAYVDARVSLATSDGSLPNYPDVVPTALTLPMVMLPALVLQKQEGGWVWEVSLVVGALGNAAILNGAVVLLKRFRAKLASRPPHGPTP
jgi:hypothetical protein